MRTGKIRRKGPAETMRIATVLAGEVLQRYKKLRPLNIGPLRASKEIVKLPLPIVSEKEIEERGASHKFRAVTAPPNEVSRPA